MTQDEIIEMANEAGFFLNINCQIPGFEKFAELVAKKERAEFAVHAIDIVRRAIKEEREACAKVCEAYQDPFSGNVMAETIRARGNK